MTFAAWPRRNEGEAAALRGSEVVLIGGQHMLSYNFWLEARNVAEGIHIIAPIGSPTTPELPRTIDLLRAAGVIPDLVALNSFATVQVWAEAVRRAGAGDPRKVIEALQSGEFQRLSDPSHSISRAIGAT